MAVITLEEELTFSDRISPICLPQTASEHPGKVPISVQGWGKDADGSFGKKVSEVNLGIRRRNECDHKFKNASFDHGDAIGRKVQKLMPELSQNVLFCARANTNSQVVSFYRFLFILIQLIWYKKLANGSAIIILLKE